MINYVTMAINTRCNNSCIWCYGKSVRERDFNMSVKTFEKALSLIKLSNCKQIIFLGGEPTLHPYLVDFIHEAIANQIYCIVVSNGSGYSLDFLDSIEDVKDMITLNVSIEGSTAEIHDKITNKPGSFQKLLNGIEAARSKNFDIIAIMTLCRDNKHDLGNVFCLLKSMGIDRMSVNFANKPLNVTYSDEDYLTIAEFEEAVTVSRIDSMQITVSPSLPLCSLSLEFQKILGTGKVQLNNSCQLLFGKAFTIDAKGNILYCNHLTEVKTGNINDITNLAKLNKSLKDMEMRAKNALQKYPLEKCNKCDKNLICFGGCPLLWI